MKTDNDQPVRRRWFDGKKRKTTIAVVVAGIVFGVLIRAIFERNAVSTPTATERLGQIIEKGKKRIRALSDNASTILEDDESTREVKGIMPYKAARPKAVEIFTETRPITYQPPSVSSGKIGVMSFLDGAYRPETVFSVDSSRLDYSMFARPEWYLKSLRETPPIVVWRSGGVHQIFASTKITGEDQVRVTVYFGGGMSHVAIAIDDKPFEEVAFFEVRRKFWVFFETRLVTYKKHAQANTRRAVVDYTVKLPPTPGGHIVTVGLVAKNTKIYNSQGPVLRFDCKRCNMESATWPGLRKLVVPEQEVATDLTPLKKYAAGAILYPYEPATTAPDLFRPHYRPGVLDSVPTNKHTNTYLVARSSGITELAIGNNIESFYLPVPGIYDVSKSELFKRARDEDPFPIHESSPMRIKTPADKTFRRPRPGEFVVEMDFAQVALDDERARIAREGGSAAIPLHPVPAAADLKVTDKKALFKRSNFGH